MRILNLDGPKARYERIRLLKEAAGFGLELNPQATAPFTVGWCSELSGAELLFRRTRVAYVSTRDAPQLRIRDEYPEDKDGALIRALENAADLTDEVGRMKRAEAAADKEGKTAVKLFSKRPQPPFTITGHTPLAFLRALAGADACYGGVRSDDFDPDRTPDQIRVHFRRGNTTEKAVFTTSPDGLTCAPQPYAQYHLEEAPFRALLAQGAKHWDAHITPQTVEDACRAVLRATPETDITLNRDYDHAAYYDRLLDAPDVRCGQMSCDPQFVVRLHGVMLANQGQMGRLTRVFRTVPADMGTMSAAANAMRLRMRAARLGARVEDFRVINADEIRGVIDTTDIGYHL